MRVLNNAEIRAKVNRLREENGMTKAQLQRKIDALLVEAEEDYAIVLSGLHGNKAVYKKLEPAYNMKFNAEDISLIANALDVDTDYLLTDTDIKRKEIRDASNYLGISESAVRRILAMKKANKEVLDDFLTADLDIDKTDIDLETVLDVSENVKNNSDMYNEAERLGLGDWNTIRFEADHKANRQNSLAQAAFLFRDFLKAVYPLKR